MVTNIIQIGNSKGIILPSEILKQLRLSLKSAVSISLDGNNIVIKAHVFEDEKFEDWTW